MSASVLHHELAIALVLHRSGSPDGRQALNAVGLRARAEWESDADLEVARVMIAAAVAQGEAESDRSMPPGARRIEAAARFAREHHLYAEAAAAFRSVAAVSLRENEPERAVEAAAYAMQCAQQAGDSAWAERSRVFCRLWQERITAYPDMDWGAWVRSG
ncbi:hypothetical protein [Herbiconiux sp. A18JL235]|uniref:Uncharacterized protein n=1 Tax=Herbiconiux sp. A18JL235 TaxID=3152363 RepID=A0AB39BFP8_9MICO